MDKVGLIQSPSKFYEAVPVFCQEAIKIGFFDRIYIVTDYKGPHDLPKNCHIIQLNRDMQFSSNMLRALDVMKEDIFFVCCEDHILIEGNDQKQWNTCFRYIRKHPEVGYLRLTNNDRVPGTPGPEGEFFFKIKDKKKYRYYVCLQPAFWRREYFLGALSAGEDAWKFEFRGSRRLRNHKTMWSFCTRESVAKRTNFFQGGEHYRHKFVNYALEHGIKLNKDKKVHCKIGVISFDEYIKYHEQQKSNNV